MTGALQHLRLNGPTRAEDLPVKIATVLLRLTFPVVSVRDCQPAATLLVEIVDGRFVLTDYGRRLTSLMK